MSQQQPPDQYKIGTRPTSKFASAQDEMVWLLRSIRGALLLLAVLGVLAVVGGVVGVAILDHAFHASSSLTP